MPFPAPALESLRDAYADKRITLYLGAGVSVGNGLPTWDQLVLSMYFDAIQSRRIQGWRPFPNYLYAIAEWHLERAHEPLEITARKLRKYYEDEEDFLGHLRRILYAGFSEDLSASLQEVHPQALRQANGTLHAVAELCEQRTGADRSVRSIVSYNYDGLLEIALGRVPFQPVWNSEPAQPDHMPIYHVHGFVPVGPNEGSTAQEIVFTEEQYHQASFDAYSWSNLVQIHCMSSTVGLMVGLSLADRNMRRLLDAINRTPVHSENYALLQEPSWKKPSDEEVDEINDKAMGYFERFERSGIKVRGPGPGTKGPSYQHEIRGILGEVEKLEKEHQTYVLEKLGVQPIWYKNHEEIPGLLAQIRQA